MKTSDAGLKFDELTEEHLLKPCVLTAKLPDENQIEEHKDNGMNVDGDKAVYKGRIKEFCENHKEEEGLSFGLPFEDLPFDNVHNTVWIRHDKILSVRMDD